ncbi:hypothetical protein [Roseococcus sp. YIM B11640]|uniref:hypothetical protein n=1 Tax=Roseococcus sp. YIM B11640 TaxID=3133973 RepID=UPI003C7ACC06
MRVLSLTLLALSALLPDTAFAQRTGPHDGVYVGHRVQECRRTGRSGRQLLAAEVHGATMTIPGLPGDPPLEATIGPNAAVSLPRIGTFGPGEGQIFEGPNNARRFTGSHPGRGGDCSLVYDLIRQRPGGGRR